MIYLCQCDKVVYVAEAMSNEEATIKLFNNMVSNPKEQMAMTHGLRPIKECPEMLVSTPESREVLFGY
jgi:hypothetical protein